MHEKPKLKTKEAFDYSEIVSYIEEKYHIDIRDSIWQWLLDYPWDGEVTNGCYQTFDVEDFKETATDQKADKIVEILSLFEEEFGKEFRVWIDW